VALCAGDFAANKEMLTDIADHMRWEAEARGDLDLIAPSMSFALTRDGSGIRLGVWAGGHVEIGPHSVMGEGDPGTGSWFLRLDGNGERFCDEAAGTTLLRPKGSIVVTIHDANWRTVYEMMPPRHAGIDTAHTKEWPIVLHRLDNVKPGPGTQKIVSMNGSGSPLYASTIYCANTIEELIDYLDCYQGEIKKKALASIARYKELCDKGADEDFGKDPRILKVTVLKDPPFYASILEGMGGTSPAMLGSDKIGPGLCATTGLDTDADGHVLNKEFKPIKGLYAAGNSAGGRFIVTYQSPLAGISVGTAMTDGYLLGERLAAL
jgi:hypothetical protein